MTAPPDPTGRTGPRHENSAVLSLIGWTGLARVVRGKILWLCEEDYAVAARLLGASHGRIIFRHLLLRTWSPTGTVSWLGRRAACSP